MGFRASFYALILAVGLLGAMGLGLVNQAGQKSSDPRTIVSAAPLGGDNVSEDESDNESGDESDNDSGGDNDDECAGPGLGVLSSFLLVGDGDNASEDDEDNESDGDECNGDNEEVRIVVVAPTPTTAPARAQATPAAAAAPPVSPAPQGPCFFQLGFLFLHNLLAQVGVDDGGCVTNESHNPVNGDGLQLTGRGLMVWQKSTNTMRWTDGNITHTYSACGLQTRLNTQSFGWEVGQGGSCALAT